MTNRESSWMVLLGCFVVLAGLSTEVRTAAAQAQGDCPVPPGVTLPEDPSVTAQQVEDGSASLMDFALAAREKVSRRVSGQIRAAPPGSDCPGRRYRRAHTASGHRSGKE